MKKAWISITIATVISGLLFYVMNLMTPSAGIDSGNGNPAIVLIPILFPLFVYLVYSWIKVLKFFHMTLRVGISTLLLITFHWVIGLYIHRVMFDRHRETLADAYEQLFGYVDWEYIDHITSSLLSIHTNKLYFNLNTFFMYLTLSILLSVDFVLVKKHLNFGSVKD
ncbi:hypothetical protein [Evansella tamaricis]|uniref:NADH dehydrogenase subunit 6 n=1 Tax=Evansella tamaricis TaxID=2069301 RepID=A0ABS6JE02_9BACI|nr:hypothetical protein [Evansella tamaricis]MBU9711723.1 hypothetical protein [Evansella tamaricis]